MKLIPLVLICHTKYLPNKNEYVRTKMETNERIVAQSVRPTFCYDVHIVRDFAVFFNNFVFCHLLITADKRKTSINNDDPTRYALGSL
jgi:hypothetical protein